MYTDDRDRWGTGNHRFAAKDTHEEDGTFVDKRAKKIVEKVDTIVNSLRSATNNKAGSDQGPNSQTSITPLMLDEAFHSVNNCNLFLFFILLQFFFI